MTFILYIVFWLFFSNSIQKQVNPGITLSEEIATETSSTFTDTVDVPVKRLNTIGHKLPIQHRAFKDGEELTFRIRYGFVTAGTAKMRVSKETYKTIPVYHLRTTAVSASAFSWIYEVDDIVSSFVDYKQFYPIRFEKRLREGGYKVDLLTDYMPQDSLAKVEFIRYKSNMKVKKRNVYDVKVPPFSQDVLSSFYYIRLQDLNVGESVFLTNHEKKKVYDLEVIVHKKETIEVEAGTFRCIMVEPVVKGEGLFKSKGRLRVWLTDDERKIPVQMKTEVLVGDITTELIRIRGVDGKIAAQKN